MAKPFNLSKIKPKMTDDEIAKLIPKNWQDEWYECLDGDENSHQYTRSANNFFKEYNIPIKVEFYDMNDDGKTTWKVEPNVNKEQKIKEAKVLKEQLETITGKKVRLVKEGKSFDIIENKNFILPIKIEIKGNYVLSKLESSNPMKTPSYTLDLQFNQNEIINQIVQVYYEYIDKIIEKNKLSEKPKFKPIFNYSTLEFNLPDEFKKS